MDYLDQYLGQLRNKQYFVDDPYRHRMQRPVFLFHQYGMLDEIAEKKTYFSIGVFHKKRTKMNNMQNHSATTKGKKIWKLK